MATKKAAIYDPYLDTLGGGERYCLTVAEILIKNGYSVDIFWSGDKTLIEKAEKRFSLDLKELKMVPDIFGIKPQNLNLLETHDDLSKFTNRVADPFRLKVKLSSISKKIKNNRKYDVLFYLSDGSIPLLFGKKNLSIIMTSPQESSVVSNQNYLPTLFAIPNLPPNTKIKT